MNKRKLMLWLVTVCLLVALLPTVAFAGGVEEWYQDPYTGEWYYYIDGEMVTSKVLQINGNFYGFDWEGKMYTDQTFWSEYYDGDRWYYGDFRAKADGKLYVNTWYQDGSEWYYYSECGVGADDFEQIEGTWYFFDDGIMVTNQLVWSYEYGAPYIISADGKDSTRVWKTGWYSFGGNWYYIGEYGLYYDEVYKIDGSYYGFDSEGVMYDNERFWCWYYGEDQTYSGYYYAKKGGALVVNNWIQEGSTWYYYGKHGCAPNDFYKIGNTWYFFDYEGRMVTNEIVWSDEYQASYIISADGASYKTVPNTGWFEFNGDWYYNKNGERCHGGVYKIDSSYYGFDYDGVLYDNERFWSNYDGSYSYFQAKKGGSLIVNNWYQDGDDWYYFGEYGRGANGFVRSGGVWYYFSDGRMLTDTVEWDSEAGRHYALGKSGAMIASKGWHTVGGSYVYAEAGGALAEGWKKLGNSWYYLYPQMAANDLTTIDGVLYAINNKGVCTEVTANGIYDIGYGNAYVENGKIYFGWKKIGGAWYYFDHYMVTDGVYDVDGVKYVFDQTGKMFTGGWIWLGEYNGYYAYADSQGRAYTGVKTIGGTKYVFDSWGQMYADTTVTVDGMSYVVNKSGAVVSSDSVNGWKQIGGKWYYKQNGYFVEGEAMFIDGTLYAFDYDGVMITNQIVDTYIQGWGYDYILLGSNGAALKGWQKHNGQWVYGDSDGILVSGRWEIGGNEYIFSNCYMKTGTFVWDESIITTNSSGAIVSEKNMADGWTYSDGSVYYQKNGDRWYTGWVGDYYIMDGRMQVNTTVHDDNADCYYFVDTYGRYVKSGWCHRQYPSDDDYYVEYYYAKAGGKLAQDEWVKLGNTWYYFDHIYMAWGGVYEIDGELCKFDENGKYLGTVGSVTGTDGWKQVGKDWYYIHAGQPVVGKTYIDGSYYIFNYSGVMQANGFVSDYETGYYYVNSSGAVQKYTGWKQFNGQWCYFDANHRAVLGWFQVDGQRYYGDIYEKNNKLYVGLLTGWMADGTYLHVFASNGVYQGTRGVENGWYQLGSDWLYFENGKLVDGYRVIGGVGYYFSGGFMVTNDTVYVDGRYYYFGSNGAQVTKAGWLQTSLGRICVKADGSLYNGVCKIDGIERYFVYGIMIR